MSAAISFEDVSKRYSETARPALDHVSLNVAQGEFIALVGQSGSGKSTLLSMINRLTDPSDGVVRFDGEDVRKLDPIALRRRIGYVFQDIGLFPHMTLAENIAIVPKLLGWEPDRQVARADEFRAIENRRARAAGRTVVCRHFPPRQPIAAATLRCPPKRFQRRGIALCLQADKLY
mgnify:CR=1 FL=1